MFSDTDTSINLAKFDSSLGDLTGIYIEYWTRLENASVAMDNDLGVAQNGTAKVRHINLTLNSSLSMIGADFQPVMNSTDLTVDAEQLFVLGATTGDPMGFTEQIGHVDYAVWSPGLLQATGSGKLNSALFEFYTGSGTYSVTVNAELNTSASFSGSDGHFQGSTPNGTFGGTVIYTYSPIPEPATASMMALAGLIALLVRRHVMD
jgi:hypothetical protein